MSRSRLPIAMDDKSLCTSPRGHHIGLYPSPGQSWAVGSCWGHPGAILNNGPEGRPPPWRAANSWRRPRETARRRPRSCPLADAEVAADGHGICPSHVVCLTASRGLRPLLKCGRLTSLPPLSRNPKRSVSKSNAKNYSESMTADPNVTAERRQLYDDVRPQETGQAVETSKPEPPGRHGRSPGARCRRRCEECGMCGRRVFGDHALHLPGEQFGLWVVVGVGRR